MDKQLSTEMSQYLGIVEDLVTELCDSSSTLYQTLSAREVGAIAALAEFTRQEIGQ